MKEARELHKTINGFERFAIAQDKEIARLQALVDEQAEQIESLLKTVEALVVACEQAADKERDKCAADYLQDCCNAIDVARLEEREACAKLCESQIKSYTNKQYTTDPLGGYRERFASKQCAVAIRSRGEK